MSTTRGTSGTDGPKPALSVLIRVRGALPNLRPAEQRVAAAVLADPAGVSESSITALARQCETSETTVLRFCRAIGLAGYPDLRLALARAAQEQEGDQPSSAHLTPGLVERQVLVTWCAGESTCGSARAMRSARLFPQKPELTARGWGVAGLKGASAQRAGAM